MGIRNKSWLDLGKGEEVLWWNHPHILHYIIEILVGIAIAAGSIAILFLVDVPFVEVKWWHASIGFLLGIVYSLSQFVVRSHHYYVVTTQKLVEKRGIIREDRDPVHFTRIANTKMTRTVAERIVTLLPILPDIADIYITTAGTNGTELYLLDIPDADSVSQLIEDRMVQSSGGGAGTAEFEGTKQPQKDYPDDPRQQGQPSQQEQPRRQRRNQNNQTQNNQRGQRDGELQGDGDGQYRPK